MLQRFAFNFLNWKLLEKREEDIVRLCVMVLEHFPSPHVDSETPTPHSQSSEIIAG